MKEVAQAPTDADGKTNRFAAAQKLVLDETQRLLAAFLKSESAASAYSPSDTDIAVHKRLTDLVSELLSGYNQMDPEHIKDMEWINPVLLGAGIQSKNAEVRLSVQKFVQHTSPTPNPYPAPPKVPSKEESEGGDRPGAPKRTASSESHSSFIDSAYAVLYPSSKGGESKESVDSDAASKEKVEEGEAVANTVAESSELAPDSEVMPKPDDQETAAAPEAPKRTSSSDMWGAAVSWFGGAKDDSAAPAGGEEKAEEGGPSEEENDEVAASPGDGDEQSASPEAAACDTAGSSTGLEMEEEDVSERSGSGAGAAETAEVSTDEEAESSDTGVGVPDEAKPDGEEDEDLR